MTKSELDRKLDDVMTRHLSVFEAKLNVRFDQIDKKFAYHIKENDLLQVPKGDVTEKGIRKNINVGILYIESWLMGVGAAALYNHPYLHP